MVVKCFLLLLWFIFCHFFSHRTPCNDQLLVVWQIIEKVTTRQGSVMTKLIDFKKAFNCVHRPSAWCVLKKYWIPSDVIMIIQNLYEDGQSSVKWIGVVGEWFSPDWSNQTRVHLVTSSVCPCNGLDYEKKTPNGLDMGSEWTNGSSLCDYWLKMVSCC